MDTRIQINKTYEQQFAYDKAATKLFDDFLHALATKDNKNVPAKYILFYELYGDFFGKETALIHSLKETIELLK